MKICVTSDLNQKFKPCDIIFLIKDPIPKSVKSSPITSEMWLVRDFYNLIMKAPSAHCIGSYFEFSSINDTVLNRLHKLTKFKFDIIQNREFNIITENEVCKFWIGNDFKNIPKGCDIVIVNDTPDEKTLTQSRKKTNGNIELATIIKEKQPQVVIYPSDIDTILDDKKNCITKFATVANTLYINYEEYHSLLF